MPRINVVIPFYQREPGILPVAVNSALAQAGDDLLVTVVDDGSPVPARDELASIVAHDPRVVIIEQANAGPGSARNRGLDAAPEDVEYIAFLDSDDRWLPGHLANGLRASRLGADFYFANHQEHGSSRLRFGASGKFALAGVPIPGEGELFFYQGDLFDVLLRRPPIGTSTVMFRRSAAPRLRFPAGLIRGEDTYFWVGLGRAANKVAFSRRCEAVYGTGVNILARVDWGAPEVLTSAFHGAKAYRQIATDFPVNAHQQQLIADYLRRLRRDFLTTLLHLLRRGKRVDWSIVAAYARMEPRLLSDFVTLLGKGLISKAWDGITARR